MLRFDEGRSPSLTAFALYLRTGLRVAVDDDVEVKFNPWHDPSNGRFTFGGQGRYFPAGSRSSERRQSELRDRGGGFGGGGASGSWAARPQGSTPASKPLSSAAVHPKRSETRRSSERPPHMGGLGSIHVADGSSEQPLLQIEKNGYRYQIDAHVRSREIFGQLQAGTTEGRSRRAQAQAGGKDRRRSDDGGHYIGVRFNGPREAFNHFAQDAGFNRGRYRALEDNWAKSVRSGQKVFVNIVPHYNGNSQRPYKITVVYFVDDKRYRTEFPNGK